MHFTKTAKFGPKIKQRCIRKWSEIERRKGKKRKYSEKMFVTYTIYFLFSYENAMWVQKHSLRPIHFNHIRWCGYCCCSFIPYLKLWWYIIWFSVIFQKLSAINHRRFLVIDWYSNSDDDECCLFLPHFKGPFCISSNARISAYAQELFDFIGTRNDWIWICIRI